MGLCNKGDIWKVIIRSKVYQTKCIFTVAAEAVNMRLATTITQRTKTKQLFMNCRKRVDTKFIPLHQ